MYDPLLILLEKLGLELESSLKKSITGEATFIKCDVTKEDDIKVCVGAIFFLRNVTTY